MREKRNNAAGNTHLVHDVNNVAPAGAVLVQQGRDGWA